jgi:HAD superfamily hydrolase (TIGR01509 family)
VFDLDGTLTVAAHDFDGMRDHLGIGRGADILDAIARMSPDEALRARRTVDVWERDVARRSRPARGACEIVAWLKARACRVGVVTRNTRASAWVTLRKIGLADSFSRDHVLGRDDVQAKPHPAGVLHLAHAWGLAPDSLVMVGDHVSDLEAGRAAGAATILVHPDPPTPWCAQADWAAPSIASVWEAASAAEPRGP